MGSIASDFQQLVFSIQSNLYFVAGLICFLLVIQVINCFLRYRLNIFGVHPRSLFGLIGIFFSPFLHGSFEHLFFNAVALFILINMILMHGFVTFYFVTFVIVFLSGLAVWMFGKPGIHVGASGVIMGYFGYLFVNAYKQPTVVSIALAVVCIYYFGGAILMALFSDKKGVSWAGHFYGFVAGMFAAYLCSNLIYWG